MYPWMRSVRARCLSVLILVVGIETALSARVEAGQGQATSLNGTVVARATGQPIAGATVTVEGSAVMAMTNGLGRFELSTASGSDTLVASAAGYLELRVPIGQPQGPLTIELERTPNFLETVQVTATKSSLRVGDVAAPDHRRGPRDDRAARRSAAHRGRRARAGRARHDRTRGVRVGPVSRHAAGRQRVHQHAAAHRRCAADQFGQRGPRGGAADQRRQQHRGRARAQLRALRTHRHRGIDQRADRGSHPAAGVQDRSDRRPVRDREGRGERVGADQRMGRLLRVAGEGAQRRLLGEQGR